MSKNDRFQVIVQTSSRLLQFEELYSKMVYQLNKEQREELSTSQTRFSNSSVEEGQRWSFTVNSLLSSCVLEEEKWAILVMADFLRLLQSLIKALDDEIVQSVFLLKRRV